MKICYLIKTITGKVFEFDINQKLETTIYGYQYNKVDIDALFEGMNDEDPLYIRIDGFVHEVKEFTKVKTI